MNQKDHRLLIVSGVCSDAWLASLLYTCISELATRSLSQPEFLDFDTIGLWTFNRRVNAEDLAALAKVFEQGLYQHVFVTGFFHADEFKTRSLPNSVHPVSHPCLSDDDLISLVQSLEQAGLNSSWLSVNKRVNSLVAMSDIDTFELDTEVSFAELLFAYYVDKYDIDSLQSVWEVIVHWLEIKDYLYGEYDKKAEESKAWEFLDKPLRQIDTTKSSREFIKHFKVVYKRLRELLNLPKHDHLNYITFFSKYYNA